MSSATRGYIDLSKHWVSEEEEEERSCEGFKLIVADPDAVLRSSPWSPGLREVEAQGFLPMDPRSSFRYRGMAPRTCSTKCPNRNMGNYWEISHLTKEVQNAKALIDGVLFSDDMTITSESSHKVDFLVPFKTNLPARECSLEGIAGLLVFTGSVSALTTNDVEDSPSQRATQVIFRELRDPYSFSFPRRILIPWLAGSYICDYLQQSETTKDAMERCKEVISLEAGVEDSSILEPEVAATLSVSTKTAGEDSALRFFKSGLTPIMVVSDVAVFDPV